MPEYLAPGVYVEEVSFRSKSIEGVSTTTTAFVGPTRYGPVREEPDVLTSLADFERGYGDGGQLQLDADENAAPMHNYMWHAVRAFFENGGARLYVKRVFVPNGGDDDGRAGGYVTTKAPGEALTADEKKKTVGVHARFPGAAGDRRVRFTLQRSQNVLAAGPRVNGLQDRDVVWIGPVSEEPGAGTPAAHGFYLARAPEGVGTWTFELIVAGDSGGGGGTPAEPVVFTDLEPGRDQVMIVTASVTDHPADPDALPVTWANLPLDPAHQRARRPDSVFALFGSVPANRAQALTLPVVISAGDEVETGGDVLNALFAAIPTLKERLGSSDSTDDDRSVDVHLVNGNDGKRPTAAGYEGGVEADDSKTGLVALEDIEDVSIVAAPGSTFGYEGDYRSDAQTINSLLVAHCERMRYRIAVLDSGDGQTVGQVRAQRALVDSTHAALYYPWVTVLDPLTGQEIQLPPSGFVSGIYARNDIERAVYKAPANEVVALAIGFERTLNKGQQDVLNPEGVNCFRFFPGRGHRLWGARTATSDPEWKYVNLRRYFAYLEHSIDRGTQWAVFEPNGDRLWANVRRTVEDFLFTEWQNGALLGDKPEKAFFVKCDRTTMTQNDLDNGRLVCLVGVAPLRPAEYVIFRVGQWTADQRA